MSKPATGQVFFGAELLNGLHTPFIQVTSSSGRVITLTADCGVESEEDAKALCQYIFNALTNPAGKVEYHDDGGEIQ